jgi:hypothetical protein
LGTAWVSHAQPSIPDVAPSILDGCDVPKAVTFFPFLMSCTLTHFRIAELGCLASTPTFSRTMPLAWEDPPKGEDLYWVPRRRCLKLRSAHRFSRRLLRSLRAALRPLGCPVLL